MTFHDIEGGFGESKKAMLAKDIALIHRREPREINERITLNRKRFKDGVDIIDLLGIGLTDTQIKKFGFTQQSINSSRGLKAKGYSSGIYIVSERGYAKLLKILEDDVAWEQYEKLVDGYFNMRAETPKMSPMELLELQFGALKEQKQEIKVVKEDVKNLKDNMPLFNIDCEELQKAVKKKAVKCLGGYNRKAYYDKSLRTRVFGDIQREIKRQFEVNSYKAIKRSQLEIAKEIVDKYEVPFVLKDEITLVNNQIAM